MQIFKMSNHKSDFYKKNNQKFYINKHYKYKTFYLFLLLSSF